MYACLPSSMFFFIKLLTLSSIHFVTAYVSIFFLFGGSSSIIEISRSPYKIRANVLGIGVAVITNSSGLFPFATIFPLCLTPNLCCSSVTTNPKFLKTTSSTNKACVPIKTSIVPFSKFSSISLLFFVLVPPNNNSHFIPNGSSTFVNSCICCSAKIAVGAIIAT